MSDTDNLLADRPALAAALPRVSLASLPTPVRRATLELASGKRDVLIKEDNRSGELYGGNKVRKLEYLLGRARARNARTIATFGTAGSHHALATALYARQQGFEPVAFLSHQAHTQDVAAVLNTHIACGTEIVRYGGSRERRIATLRKHLRGRRAQIIPTGGSSWLGTVGFIDAALELAAQVRCGDCERPDRIYVATGTMGTAVGLALGLALAGLDLPVHAVRISHPSITNEDKLERLAVKTLAMLRRHDPGIPGDLVERMHLTLRHEFFGDGYAQTNAATERAIELARRDLNLKLEVTYTGKAMAALLADLRDPSCRRMIPLFWQSYHGASLPAGSESPADTSALPEEFLRYFC